MNTLCSRLLQVGYMLGLCLPLFAACTTKQENIYITQSSADRKTSVLGYVLGVDEYGNVQPKQAGVTVTVKDLTPAVQAVTDTNGRFKLDSLRGGNYVLQYAKPGYGTYERDLKLNVVGGNQPFLLQESTPYGDNPYAYLYQIASTTPLSFSALANPFVDTLYSYDSLLSFSGTIAQVSTTQKPRTVALLLDTVPGVTQDKFMVGYALRCYGSTFRLTVPVMARNSDFIAGRRYYARVFGAPQYVGSTFDREKGRFLITGFSANGSEERSVLVP